MKRVVSLYLLLTSFVLSSVLSFAVQEPGSLEPAQVSLRAESYGEQEEKEQAGERENKGLISVRTAMNLFSSWFEQDQRTVLEQELGMLAEDDGMLNHSLARYIAESRREQVLLAGGIVHDEEAKERDDALRAIQFKHGQAVAPWHPVSARERNVFADVYPLGTSTRGAYMAFHIARKSDKVIALFNMKTKQIEQEIPVKDIPSCDDFSHGELLFSPDNTTIALKMFDGPLITFDRKAGKFLRRIKRAPAQIPEGMQADGRVAKMEFLPASSNLKLYLVDGTCEVVDARTGETVEYGVFISGARLDYPGDMSGEGMIVERVAGICAVSTDNTCCAQVIGDSEIVIWEQQDGIEWRPAKKLLAEYEVVQVSFIPDMNHMVIVIRQDPNHRFWFDLWDIQAGAKAFSKEMVRPSYSFLPDRNFVAVYGDVSAPHDIHVWDLKQLIDEYKKSHPYVAREGEDTLWRTIMTEDEFFRHAPAAAAQDQNQARDVGRVGNLFAGLRALIGRWGF